MGPVMTLKPVPMTCKCGDIEACEQCMHARCEYCNEVGERKAQTFDEAILSDGPCSIIFYRCPKQACQRHADHDFEMGKEMAKERDQTI